MHNDRLTPTACKQLLQAKKINNPLKIKTKYLNGYFTKANSQLPVATQKKDSTLLL